MLFPVILAGGQGSRLWPLSRASYPKQFTQVIGSTTLLQQTYQRLSNLNFAKVIVVCNQQHRFIVAEQLKDDLNKLEIILEPIGKNTAPAIALAAMHAQSIDPNARLLVLPADHYIQDLMAFEKAVDLAESLTIKNKIVTFGIVPNSVHTGYGYIKKGNAFESGFIVDKFVEKPSLMKAQHYLSTNEYLWNSGMFMFNAKLYLKELSEYRPEVTKACFNSVDKAVIDLDFIRIDETEFAKCSSESIDYAVMQNTHEAVVVPFDAQWSDIGSWSAIRDLGAEDSNGNVINSNVVIQDSKNCLVISDERLICVAGVDHLVVVDSKDALLITHIEKTQQVKNIVNELQQSGRNEWEVHRTVYRPWGHYRLLEKQPHYQVKLIKVKIGGKLSLQKHQFRAEHWIIISGSAKVTIEDNTTIVTENQSVYIPIGKVHSLENHQKLELELIEVQTGSYLGEDDIIRLKDFYGRE